MQSIIKNSYKKKKKAIFWLHFLNETGKLLPVFLWFFKYADFSEKSWPFLFVILQKEQLNHSVVRFVIHAPAVAAKAEPGQFIILRVDEMGERIPLTIADYDRDAGTVTIIVQSVGATTYALCRMEVGESLQDFVGPLGRAMDTTGLQKVNFGYVI